MIITVIGRLLFLSAAYFSLNCLLISSNCLFLLHMKWIIWILLMLFGLFPSGLHDGSGSARLETAIDSKASVCSHECGNNSVSLLSMPVASYSAEETSSFAASVRTVSQSRHNSHSTRSNFKVIKSGRIIDRCVSRSFGRCYAYSPSGPLAPDKYLYIIRILLI